MFYTFVKVLGENREVDFFFYTEKLSILSVNINGYLWLGQQPILKTLLAFIFFREVGKD